MSAPNIIVILADDLGYGDISCQHPLGAASPLQTPNINALAAAGLRYTDAHSPSTVCTPTRYGVLTGNYAWRSWLKSQVLWPYGSPLLRDETTFAQLLFDAGYNTSLVGKWHLGFQWERLDGGQPSENKRAWPENTIDLAGPITHGPTECGFNTFFGVDAPNFPPYAYISDKGISGAIPTTPKPSTQFGLDGLMQTGWDVQSVFSYLKAFTLSRLNRSIDQGRPFLLHLPLTAPHLPISPSAPWVGSTTIGPIGDYIREMDAHIGDIVSTLAARGVANDTIIIFASDNGSPAIRDNSGAPLTGFSPNAPWSGGKHNSELKEGGHRIPLIVKWPGTIAPGVVSRTVCLTDIARTITDVAGITPPIGFGKDSVSLATDWTGTPPTHSREAVIHHSYNGKFAIRKDKWKAVEGPNGGELYDLTADHTETTNLASTNWTKWRELMDLLRVIQASPASIT